MKTNLVKSSHFVPKLYQKNFAVDGYIHAYRTLVSHERVPSWKRIHISAIGYREHLYTRLLGGQESDEIERWLNVEFESPAEEPLRKAVAGAKLRPDDWERLVRFALSLDVRNPVWFQGLVKRLGGEMPELFRGAVDFVAKHGRSEHAPSKSDQYFPRQIEMKRVPGGDNNSDQVEVEFKLSYSIGRGLWLGQMKHALEEVARKHGLYRKKWTILRFPEDVPIVTSDNPVVKLNRYENGRFDFKGGWANPGTEIFLPLSPQYLLFTSVGASSQMTRGQLVPKDKALVLRALIARHASRLILAPSAVSEVKYLRPRIVDERRYLEEKAYWESWHKGNTAAERQLLALSAGQLND